MSATVKVLPTPSDKRRESVVALLERMLERAKSGEIESVALFVFTEDHVEPHWSHISEVPQKIGMLWRLMMAIDSA